MASDLVIGAPKAGALQSAIQKELVAKGYSDEADLVMAEYITIMLINSKTAEQITAELVDLVGPEYDTTFTSWLFDEVAKISGSTPDAAFDSKSAQPDSQLRTASGNSRLLNHAVAEATSAPSPPQNQKRRADGRSPSPASKARRTTDLPDRPRAMRDGPSTNEPQPVRSLLDRVEPPRRHNNFDPVQAQIDAVTRGRMNGGGGGRGGGGGMQMNGHGPHGPPQQMMMNQMMGGVNPMMFQEMMANQMAIMSQMAANMGMMQGGPPMMGPGGPGFGFPNGHGQGPNMNGRGGRGGGRGGRGGNMGDRPPVGPPQQQQQQQQFQQQPPQQIAAPQARPPAPPAAPLNVPTRPQSPTLCKFGMNCTNAGCRYSHPSAEGGLVLSSEYCEKGLECKDADCAKGHPSPAAVNGVPVQQQAPPPTRSAAPVGGIPCKFGVACTRPGCTFVHPQKGGKPCRFGIACTRPDCSFDHPPGRVLPGAAPPKPAHKSMTFRAAPSPAMQSGPVSKKFGPGGANAVKMEGGKANPGSENGGDDEEDVEAALAAA